MRIIEVECRSQRIGGIVVQSAQRAYQADRRELLPGTSPSEFRRRRQIAIAMLAIWTTVAMILKVVRARIGAVIAPAISAMP